MPISQIIIFIGLFSLAVHVIYLVIFHLGLNREKADQDYRKKSVSVVIAARNEEDNIGKLLTSLVNQSYPPELYEIIVADDRSSDNTSEIVTRFSEKWDTVRLVRIDRTPPSFSPKKHALSQAIRESRNEIILLTDADCLVTKYWIESMVSNFTDDVSMTAGFSRTLIKDWKKSSLLHRFEYFDFLLMLFAAAGAVLSGRYFSCTNQNLAYRRTAFEEVGGFEKIKHILSGDDVNLMQLFRKKGFKIVFSLIDHSFVYTQPVTTWGKLISQRSRWASNAKQQLTLNPEFFFYLFAVFVVHIAILFLLFFNWQYVLLLFGLKFAGEFLFIHSNYRLFEPNRQRLWFFPVWSVIQPFYLISVTIRGLLDIFSWK